MGKTVGQRIYYRRGGRTGKYLYCRKRRQGETDNTHTKLFPQIEERQDKKADNRQSPYVGGGHGTAETGIRR